MTNDASVTVTIPAKLVDDVHKAKRRLAASTTLRDDLKREGAAHPQWKNLVQDWWDKGQDVCAAQFLVPGALEELANSRAALADAVITALEQKP